jgi:hypothetical protein
VGADLHGKLLFPSDNAWNRDISLDPVDPNSESYIAACGSDRTVVPLFGNHMGIQYLVVPGTEARLPVSFDLASDDGPFPIPLNAPVENPDDDSSSRRVIVLDRDAWRLYEMVGATSDASSWRATAGAVFDLKSNDLRPASKYAANAAGLPVFAGLLRIDEVFTRKEILHALSFSCANVRGAYVAPATRSKSPSTDPTLPVMGTRVRLKADFDISRFPAGARVVLIALKRYGMFLAEQGVNWGINGEPSARWADDEVTQALRQIKGSDFEVVKIGAVTGNN